MESIHTVREVNDYINKMFKKDRLMNRLYIKGEVSNCKYHTSGHIYFSLKDESGTIACVMFAGQRNGLTFRMSQGDQIVVFGRISTYAQAGSYQVYATQITRDGAGALYEKFEELKKELLEMGMFSPEYKQAIPKYANTVGVVTAQEGAAIQDIIHIIQRRNPRVQIVLCPSKVQGEGAAESIVAAIEKLERYVKPDVMIVGRGGGSIEDLWAFNEKIVAKAIFDCTIPIISAVGHETDTTIADYVADLRAPTPSAAAELAVPELQMLLRSIEEKRMRMGRVMEIHLQRADKRLKQYSLGLRYLHPRNKLQEQQQRIGLLEDKLQNAMQSKLEQAKNRLQLDIMRLKGLSPLDKVSLGYGYIQGEDGNAITEVKQVKVKDIIQVTMSTGTIKAEVVETKGGTI